MSLTTDAEMTVPNTGKINPEPQGGMQPPKSIGAESVAPIAKPVALGSVAGVQMTVPNTVAAKPVSEFTPSAPNDLTPEVGFDMAVPNAIGNVAAGAVTAPIALTAENAGEMAAPNNMQAKAPNVMDKPAMLSSNPVTTVVSPVARASVPQVAFPRVEG